MSLTSLRPLLPNSKYILKNLSILLYIHPASNNLAAKQPTHVCERCMNCSSIHTSTRNYDLMEFFGNKKTWGEKSISTGRPWEVEELRIKSNEDLHKLWYVCLKERNMLMTTEAEYTRQVVLFPSPERTFKVEETMRNIMKVIKERDAALNTLETGVTGEPETREAMNFLGMKYKRKVSEHLVPSHMNEQYKLTHPKYEKWMAKYLILQREKELKLEKKQRLKKEKLQQTLLEKFPHLTEEDLEYAWEQELEEEKKLGSYNLTAEEVVERDF